MTEETPSQRASRMAIEAVQREMAAWDAEPTLPPRRSRKTSGGFSVVYSVRLEPGEVEMLEAQARELGMRPTVLARNLIRVGLAVKRREEVAYAVTRLQQVVDELRALVG